MSPQEAKNPREDLREAHVSGDGDRRRQQECVQALVAASG